MKPLTPAQRLVAGVLRDAGETALTARQVARAAWPDDPGWHRHTAGRGASRHTGAMGATLPLRAGRVLSNLLDLRTDAGLRLVDVDYGDLNVPRWRLTDAGARALDAAPTAP